MNKKIILAVVFSVALLAAGWYCLYGFARAVLPEEALWQQAYNAWKTESRLNRSYAADAQGKTGPVQRASTATQQQSSDDAHLLEQVSVAVMDTMTFTFENADAHFRHKVTAYFTDEGYDSFMTAIKKSHIIDSVKAMAQVVTAKTGTPAHLLSGPPQEKGAQDFWVATLPLELTYTSGAQKRTDRLGVIVLLKRPAGGADAPKIARWMAAME